MYKLAKHRFSRYMTYAAVVLFVIVQPASGEARVGSIKAAEGSVQIDAFGTGNFIAAISGDSLYQGSVIKTGFESKAELVLGTEEFTVPSDIEVGVEALLQSREKQKKTGWVPSFIKAVGRMISSSWKKEDSEVLGGRASKSETGADFWVTEDDVLLLRAHGLAPDG